MPISNAEIRHLEEIGVRTWPARIIAPHFGWLVSIDRGVTRRANSVLPAEWTGESPVDELIDAIELKYRREGLDPCFKLTRASRPADLDRHLHRRGYLPEGHSDVLTAAVSGVDHRPVKPAELTAEPTPDWIACSWPGMPTEADIDIRCQIAGRTERPKAFALIRMDGFPAGAAMAAIVRDWGCITALRTPPEYRRRGIARALVAALAGWVCRQGGEHLFLQVEKSNAPARRLYASAGFRHAYDYHYRTLKCPTHM